MSYSSLLFSRRSSSFRLYSALGSTIAVATLSALSAACSVTIEGSGVIETRTKTLEEFDSIAISNGFEGEVTISDEFRVIVHADDNLIDDVVVEQDGRRVAVSLDRNHVSNANLEVEVMVPSLEAIEIADGTSLSADDLVITGALELVARDGCHLDVSTEPEALAYLSLTCEDGTECQVDAQAEESTVEIRDGSTARLRGSGQMMTLLTSDGSSLDAKDFEVDQLNVRVHDGSTAKAHANESAQGKISDGSRLTLYGDPDDVDIETSDGSDLDVR